MGCLHPPHLKSTSDKNTTKEKDMKRIIRTVLVGTANVGMAVGMAAPASAMELLPGGCLLVGDRVFCQLH